MATPAPPATAPAPLPWPAINIFADDDNRQLTIQPKFSVPARGPVETLSINLDMGRVQVGQAEPQFGTAIEALTILGMCKLHAGNALVVVTSARLAASVDGCDVFEVAGARVITSSAAQANRANRGLLKLLSDAVDPQGSGRGLHFSFGYDITCTQQHIAAAAAADPAAWAAQLPVQRADNRFFWNKAIAHPLLSAGAAAFVQPCILGFVQQLTGLEFHEGGVPSGARVAGTLTLIARRAAARAGTRQWRRGADTRGAVANFAETEQVLSLSDGARGGAAYVIVRGSIPLLWTQLPNIKYKPTTVIAPSDVSGPAHDKHMAAMVDQYRSCVAINLINHHGTEGKLEAAFRSEASRLIQSGSPLGTKLRYVAFDFHAECGNKRYHRLSLLWDQVARDFTAQGFCRLSPATGPAEGPGGRQVVGQQQGVMRVNCIDCLDRTNVVQGVLARKALEAVLVSFGLLAPGATLPAAYPAVERQFKILWADHGDALSTQYAGTGAMKSGFTRTGKRTLGGVVDDGVKAVVRYYLNNFQDGAKQDAIDLMTGAYVCDTIHAPPLKAQPSPLIPLLLSVLALSLTAHNLVAIVTSLTGGGLPGPVPPPPYVGGEDAAAVVGGLLGTARALLTAPVYQPGASAGAAGGAQLTRGLTAASVAEPGAGGAAGGALGTTLAVYVLLPLVFGAGLLAAVVKNGKYLVNKPQLCPQLAITVAKPAAGSGTGGTKKHA